MDSDWMTRARSEVAGIKPFWAEKYAWAQVVDEGEDHLTLFVTFSRAKEPARRFVLRLRYEEDYETAGRKEDFVDADDRSRSGAAYWPNGVRGFQSKRKPPAICLEGTYGFHSILHRDRDGRLADLNRLLLEIQRCMNE